VIASAIGWKHWDEIELTSGNKISQLSAKIYATHMD